MRTRDDNISQDSEPPQRAVAAYIANSTSSNVY
jgi:hypothetical protein